MKKLFFFIVLNSNFSSYEIEDSKFVNSVHGVEYEIIGEIPDAKIAKKGTGISTRPLKKMSFPCSTRESHPWMTFYA